MVAVAAAAVIAALAAVPAMANGTYIHGGYFSDPETLTWTSNDGTVTTYGRGSVFSDVHPEITDPEYYLKETALYPGEEIGTLNSQGKAKNQYTEIEMEALKEFLHSFDWIHSDEMTRATAIYDRIAQARSGNEYGRPEEEYKLLTFAALVGGKGICSDFATEYARLAELVGLECESYDCELDHAACLLKINGQWFHLDPTSGGVVVYSNDAMYPVDYDTEKGLYAKKSKEKWDAYFEENPDSFLKEDFEMMDKLGRGEITVEEYNAWSIDYAKKNYYDKLEER